MSGDTEPAQLDAAEENDVEEHRELSAIVVYEAVRRQGEDELQRPAASLWWSGLAAGLGMGFSVAAEGTLHAALPDAPWRPLVESFGYPVGFLIVILSRQQLFTENTLTAVLPVLHPPFGKHLSKLLRLWSIVLVANLVGTALFALAVTYAPIFPDEVKAGMLAVSRVLAERQIGSVFWGAIPAGFLVATLVWTLPSAETGKIWIIIILTALLAAFGLSHVIAGSAEVFLLMMAGDVDVVRGALGIIVPMLVGNVLGGSALFALLAFGQVKDEIG